jgi:hypothetical protein
VYSCVPYPVAISALHRKSNVSRAFALTYPLSSALLARHIVTLAGKNVAPRRDWHVLGFTL